MKVNKIASNLSFLFILFSTFLIIGCSGISPSCTNGYTKDGKCCESVCQIECPNSYVEGSCNCECKILSESGDDTGIGDIFEDTNDVKPPEIPQ